eukprot:7241096-Pyramimonas_sp.AAC.1
MPSSASVWPPVACPRGVTCPGAHMLLQCTAQCRQSGIEGQDLGPQAGERARDANTWNWGRG